MGLVLTLKPQERIILGGAVVRNNGNYSAQLLIETNVPILRWRWNRSCQCPDCCHPSPHHRRRHA